MRDPDEWWARHAAAEAANPHWPDWQAKVSPAGKRIRMATRLLDVGDVEAASEELLFGTSHVARAVLLKHGTFPLSRPEIPSQLKEIDVHLAALLERLLGDSVDAAELRSGKLLLEQRIHDLSSTRPCRPRAFSSPPT